LKIRENAQSMIDSS